MASDPQSETPLAAPRGSRLHRPEWLVPVTVVCGVLGALIMLRLQPGEEGAATARYRSSAMLSEMLAGAQKQAAEQKTEIDDLRNKLTEFQSSTTQTGKTMQLLNQELQDYKTLAGVTPVKGPGISIYLDDSKVRLPMGEDADPLLIHDYDLLLVVNELRSAGAEAISINDQRMIENTAIRCVGATILVNDRRIAGPFELRAIGDPRELAGAMSLPMGVLDQLRAIKVQVKVVREEEVRLPAVTVQPKIISAKPIPPDELKEQGAP
jgi:uncharacterized protein YlxW (UPF0749 family)